jgi:hypothetical protein
VAAGDHSDQRSENTPTPVDRSIDKLAKGLASGAVSRRKALRMLGAALVGGALASSPGVAWSAKPAPCPSGKKCGRNCCPDASFACSQGKCGCPSGTTNCAGTCVDPTTFQTDPQNCGTCGNVCPSGTACTSGACLGFCPEGLSCCCDCTYCSVDENGSCIPDAPRIRQCVGTGFTESEIQRCVDSCPAPPPGYRLEGAGLGCNGGAGDSNIQLVCGPCVNSDPNSTCGGGQGTTCARVPCASGP